MAGDGHAGVSAFFVRPTGDTPFQAVATRPDWFLVPRGPTAVARMDPKRLADLGQLP